MKMGGRKPPLFFINLTIMFGACDESNIDKQIWVIGSTWISRNKLAEYEKDIATFRLREKFWGEIKWSKLTQGKLDCYKKFVGYTFEKFTPEFKAIIVDTKLVDFNTYHHKNKQLAFMKFYYFLLFNKARHIIARPNQIDTKFHIVIDEFNVSTLNFNDLKSYTEMEIKKLKSKYSGVRPVSDSIDFLGRHTSHICSLTQFTDLICGAIGEVWNGSGDQSYKQEMIKFIENYAGQPLSVPNEPMDCKFDIWKWRPTLG